MKNRKLLLNMIVAGMTLGTAWAIRGQFGHEQGAAWAGAIGAIAIILISGRRDWYGKLFKATMAAAIGWGLGGIMSYGQVVGFGRGTDFVNVYYGLLMLFVIGGLYGFVGGGLFGLTLSSTKDRKISWSKVITGAVASGIICYFFLIIEWEWLMMPPRSEVWAVCLGVGIYLTWYMVQYKYTSALRVAVFTSLGAGFGFAFGNFLQILGNLTEIPFNFWNVMEYSLGFFGGAGMAYGTFTSEWEKSEEGQKRLSNLIPILFLALFIPLVVWDQSFTIEKLHSNYGKILDDNLLSISWLVRVISLLLIVGYTIFILMKYHYSRKSEMIRCSQKDSYIFLGGHFILYIILSWLITGAFVSIHRIEQYLYGVNFIIILMAIPRLQPVFEIRDPNMKHWLRNLVLLLLFIATLAIIAISIHGEVPGMQRRF